MSVGPERLAAARQASAWRPSDTTRSERAENEASPSAWYRVPPRRRLLCRGEPLGVETATFRKPTPLDIGQDGHAVLVRCRFSTRFAGDGPVMNCGVGTSSSMSRPLRLLDVGAAPSSLEPG